MKVSADGNSPKRSSSFSLGLPSRLVTTNTEVLTDFQRGTFHLDEKSATRPHGFQRMLSFGITSLGSRFYVNLPKTQIDLNRSMNALTSWRQLTILRHLQGRAVLRGLAFGGSPPIRDIQ